ncbi:MAG: NADH-quinone oxidoreductase subunit N [Rhodothermales bacterium]|nr:NADH-quinone oxidoreductase subunit N [Rhodothermales bacterium]
MELTGAYGSLLGDLGSAFSLVVLSVVGLVMVVWDSLRNNHRAIPWIGVTAAVFAIAFELLRMPAPAEKIFYGLMWAGGFASFVNIVILAATAFTLAISVNYLDGIGHNYGEVYALVVFASVGMIVLGSANSLITVFVGLETMSICLYILTGLVRTEEGAVESALKYFLLGAFSTGFFLYGIAVLYAATGTLYLDAMQAALVGEAASGALFWGGVGLLFIGFLFKVSAAPFHMWTPDVYQGAPTTLTGFMSTASKASAFAALVLVLYYALPGERWMLVLAVVAAATMVLGNVVAIAQSNVKRMLAYSSIAHAGYVLVGLAAGTAAGYSGALFYLLVYTLMNIGAFGVMAALEWDGQVGQKQDLNSLAGIGFRKPLLGVTMGFFMFSLTGFPPLGGFIGKYAVFAPAIDAGLTWLVIVGLLASAASAYYYLRVLYVFWMKTPSESNAHILEQLSASRVPVSASVVLVVCAGLLLVLGIYPGLLESTGAFFSDAASVAASH